MDKELIERLAFDAGLGDLRIAPYHGMAFYAIALQRFAASVGEECAKLCDGIDLPFAAEGIREKFKEGC